MPNPSRHPWEQMGISASIQKVNL
jgi:hypothetical protein